MNNYMLDWPFKEMGLVSNVHGDNGPVTVNLFPGNLRDHFAGQALANLNLQAHVGKPAAEQLAASAYNIADAMLKAREQ